MGPAPAERARGVNGAHGPDGADGPNGAHGVRSAPGVPLAVLLAEHEHEPEVAELARRYLARAGVGYILDDPMDGAHTPSNRGVPATPLTAPR